MEGKVFGIPLAIIVFIFGISFFVGLPMLLLSNRNLQAERETQQQLKEVKLELLKIQVTPSPVVVSPTDTPTPTKAVQKTVAKPTAASSSGVTR